MKNILKIGLLLLLMVVSFNTFGTNYYVNDNSRTGDVYCSVVGNNANNGKTTSTPKLTLYNLWTTYGPAGTNVIVAGDVIYVDAGTYSNEESTAMLNSFVITKGITIKGAGKFLTIFNCISGTRNLFDLQANNITIRELTISAFNTSTASKGEAITNNGYTGALIYGCIIKNGVGSGYGAVYCGGASTTTFRSCTFKDNKSSMSIYGSNTLTLTIDSCAFDNNVNTIQSGGLYLSGMGGVGTEMNVNITNSAFGVTTGNYGDYGGALYTVSYVRLSITVCCFKNNHATTGMGGAVSINSKGNIVTINDCLFQTNVCTVGIGYGGAVAINATGSPYSTMTINRCSFIGNSALDGGSVYVDAGTVTLNNCLFYDNSASSEGGAICINDANAIVALYNCTITENICPSGGGLKEKSSSATVPIIKNTIIINNSTKDVVYTSNKPTVSYSIIDSRSVSGTDYTSGGSNSSTNPGFVDATNNDFRINLVTSAAYRTGNSTSAPTNDINKMVRNATPDKGCYEFSTSPILKWDCATLEITILPIELISFSTDCRDGVIYFYWTTLSETNNDYFTVEKSLDLENWTQVGQTIKGSGTINKMMNYKTNDEYISDKYYYRLKQVDFDGQFTYSHIITKECESDEHINIYPNPTENNIFIDIKTKYNNKYIIYLYNTIGELVTIKNIETEEGVNTFALTDKYTNGVYYIKIFKNNMVVYNFKIVII